MAVPFVAVTPALSTSGEDAVRYELSCGLALKFVDALGTAMTRNEFDSLGLTMPQLALAAGVHATTYIAWEQLTEGVYRNDDGCWPELVCAPSAFLEHNGVPGLPVLYVISESSAILTGSDSPGGLARIRGAMHGGLASCPMILRSGRHAWTPFDARLLIGVSGAHSGSSSTYVYLGEVQDQFACASENWIKFTKTAQLPGLSQPLQAMIKRQGRHAGLLGACFVPDPSGNEIVVSVAVGAVRGPKNGDLGLSLEDAKAVLKGLERVAGGASFIELGAGWLNVSWAETSQIDSSESGFQELAERLVPLLALPMDATADDVTNGWRRQLESVELGRMFDWLDRCVAQHPERGATFRPGASTADVEALAADLSLRLPDALRWMAARFDGGAFVDRSALTADDDADTCTADADGRQDCELLSLDEIRQEFDDLVATHEAAVELDGWAGQRPIRPRLRLADGSSSPWPYLPIARTTQGHELLVLEIFDNGRHGRVLDAFHEVGPRHWGTLYDSYVVFLDDFIYRGGTVRVISSRAGA